MSKQKDYIPVNKLNPKTKFVQLMSKFEKDQTDKKIPFCRACAWKEFHRRLTLMEMEKIDDTGKFDEYGDEVYDLAKDVDFNKYAGKEYFDEIKVDRQYEKAVIDGKKQKIHVGYIIDYKCKKYNHFISISYSIDEFEKYLNDDKEEEVVVKKSKKKSKK